MGRTKEDIDIRFVSEVDLNENCREIIELLNDNYIINFPNHDDLSEFAISNFNEMKRYLNDGSALIIGAFSGKKIYGILWAYRRLFLGEKRLHISHFVVDSAYRGYGIGTRMVKRVEKFAFENDIKYIEILTSSENRNTIQFYSKQGFNVYRVQFEKHLGENNDNY